MNTLKINIALFLSICVVLGSCYYDNSEDLYDIVIVPGTGTTNCEFTEISYSADIKPIIDLYCNGACHNSTDKLGNVILETHGNVIPYVDAGSFIGSILFEQAYEPMPPGQKLSACNISKIQFWVDNGTPNN